MSKLNDIVFKSVQSKEFDVMGKKVLIKTLTTKDNIELDVELREDIKTSELLVIAVKILSRAIVSIDGIVPDNAEETKGFLESQESSVVFKLLEKYQELNNVEDEVIKK